MKWIGRLASFGWEDLYVLPCAILFISPFSIAIPSLWEERANLSAFRMFDRFVLVWICRFPLLIDVWELWHSLDFSLTFFASTL